MQGGGSGSGGGERVNLEAAARLTTTHMADGDYDVLPPYVEEDEEEAAAAKEQRRQQSKRKKPREKMPWEFDTPEEEATMELRRALSAKLYEYDPKTGHGSYTRAWYCDLTKFDLDEETQYGPMRFTDSVIRDDHILSDSLNVLYLKIMSSDVGYPINVYGSVIARDILDDKCINIFRRDKLNCQLVQSENEDLILTGPSRGIVFYGDALFEIDLKIKEDEGCNDRQFSKGLVDVLLVRMKSKVESETLVSRLSEVQLAYAYVKNALEGTIEIKVLAGPEVFHGKVTACTTDVAHSFLLYDSNVGGAIAVGDDGLIQLLRRVLAVSEDKKLVIDIVAYSSAHNQDISCARTEFTTRIKGSDEEEITCGPYSMRVKVIWSTLSEVS